MGRRWRGPRRRQRREGGEDGGGNRDGAKDGGTNKGKKGRKRKENVKNHNLVLEKRNVVQCMVRVNWTNGANHACC